MPGCAQREENRFVTIAQKQQRRIIILQFNRVLIYNKNEILELNLTNIHRFYFILFFLR